MKECDIVFIHHKEPHFFSKAIEFFTDGYFSHVALATADKWIIDITSKGIVFENIDKYAGNCHVIQIGRFPLSIQEIFIIRNFAFGQMNKGYDLKQIVWNFTWTAAKKLQLLKFSRKLYNMNKAYEGFTCSEFIARAFREAGINLVQSYSNCSPQNLFDNPKIEKIEYVKGGV